MAGINSGEVVVGASGSVSVAPVGTTLPTTIGGALNVAFKDLGYTTEDGVTITNGRTVEEVDAWQNFYPVRRIVSAKSFVVAFTLIQWNTDNLKFALGGGSVASAAGTNTYTPASPSSLDERAMVIGWADGSKNYRIVIPRGMVTNDVETQLMRTDAANLPIEFSATPTSSSTDAFTLLTDDAAIV